MNTYKRFFIMHKTALECFRLFTPVSVNVSQLKLSRPTTLIYRSANQLPLVIRKSATFSHFTSMPGWHRKLKDKRSHGPLVIHVDVQSILSSRIRLWIHVSFNAC